MRGVGYELIRPIRAQPTTRPRFIADDAASYDRGDDPPRITDLSAVEPENIKDINETLLLRGDHYDVGSHVTKGEIRDRIWRVRNGDLKRLLEDFPTDEDLIDQCAHWMHAIVGKHFFPDGNHRTAVLLLRRLLRENGIEPSDWPTDRLAATRDESHRVRRELPPVRIDSLYRRDALFRVWRRFFEDVLTDRDE